jgi:hypothetical protein
MSDPITPLSEGAVGFVRRIFGPAASEVGEALADHFRAYRARNMRQILEKAQLLAEGNKIEALPPRFSIPLIESASLEDDPDLQEMWASLLVSAARGTSSKYKIFVDIMSQIGPDEAHFLSELFPTDDRHLFALDKGSSLRAALFNQVKQSIDWANPKEEGDALRVVDWLLDYDFGWPAVVRSARSYWPNEDQPGRTHIIEKHNEFQHSLTIDVLSRQKLIEHFEFDFSPGWASPKVDGYFMTSLGVEFVSACRIRKGPDS